MTLKEKNELDEFLYIFAHDFNAPLRHIREFTKLLLSDFDGKLDKNQKEYAHYISEGVKEAEKMLADVLRFSRINNPEEIQEINLKNVLLEISQEFKSPNNIFIINCPNDLKTKTQKGKLKNLLTELIDNSIKFNKNTQPKIEINVTENDNETRITILDNGIGNISKVQQEDVFKIFKKLNGKKFSGTGMGLALCKKILEKLNGRIFIEESNDSGTKIAIILYK